MSTRETSKIEEATASDRQRRRQAANQTGPRQIGISMRTCYCLYIAYAFYGWCIYALYNKEQNKKTTLEENK